MAQSVCWLQLASCCLMQKATPAMERPRQHEASWRFPALVSASGEGVAWDSMGLPRGIPCGFPLAAHGSGG